jgi:hypothetical protein
VKQFWSTLATEQKLAALRIQEHTLVNELYEVQQALFAADLECYVNGFHGQEKVRRKAGVQFFDIEGVINERGVLCPKAFVAHRPFVEMENVFEFLEERLGRPLLQGAPLLEERHWVSLLEPRPSSWSDFMRVCLLLVELVLRKAHREAKRTETHEPEVPSMVMSQSAKRKARKKRAMAERAVADEVVEPDEFPSPPNIAVKDASVSASANGRAVQADSATAFQTSTAMDTDAALVGDSNSASSDTKYFEIFSPTSEPEQSAQADEDDECMGNFPGASEQIESQGCAASNEKPQAILEEAEDVHEHGLCESVHEDEDAAKTPDSYDPEPVLAETQNLRQSAREARISAVNSPVLIASQALRACAREAWVSAEIRMRQERGRGRPPWILADGSSGENWLDGFRTTVKNTFLDLEKVEPESSILRARSWPSWRGGGG